MAPGYAEPNDPVLLSPETLCAQGSRQERGHTLVVTASQGTDMLGLHVRSKRQYHPETWKYR